MLIFLRDFYNQFYPDIKNKFNIKLDSSAGLGLPSCSGIYICIEIDKIIEVASVIYVGSSKNIAKRIYTTKHKLTEHIFKHRNEEISYTFVYFLTDEYIKLEKQLIFYLNPILNTKGKNKYIGKILKN